MDRIMLEVVVCESVRTPLHVRDFVLCTLLAAENVGSSASDPAADPQSPAAKDPTAVAKSCIASLSKLVSQGFIGWKATETQYVPSKLGIAAVAASMTPEHALMLHEDVQSLCSSMNLENNLHLMYLMAPSADNKWVAWKTVHQVLQRAHDRDPVMRRVCALTKLDLRVSATLARRESKGFEALVRSYLLCVDQGFLHSDESF